MANEISTNKTGFKKVTYSITALPLIAYLKLDGFSAEGVTWETVEPTNTRMGADGLVAVNQKPVLYTGTFSLMPNSNSRNMLDLLVLSTTPQFGKDLIDYNLTFTEENTTTGMRTIYAQGSIEQVQAGNDNGLDDGQGNKTYRMTFASKVMLPI